MSSSRCGGARPWFKILLAASIVVDVTAAGLVFVEISLVGDALSARPVDLDALHTNTERAVALGTIAIVALVSTAIAWWAWQYRGQANLHAAARRGLEHRPWGAVGWWLVPVANLWMPFKTMRELWKASEAIEDPSAWAGVATWPVLGWWWALWIVGNLLQSASGFANTTEDLEVIRSADITALAGLSCSVFAACLAIGVVRQITLRQEALASLQPTSTTPPVPASAASPLLAPPRPDLG